MKIGVAGTTNTASNKASAVKGYFFFICGPQRFLSNIAQHVAPIEHHRHCKLYDPHSTTLPEVPVTEGPMQYIRDSISRARIKSTVMRATNRLVPTTNSCAEERLVLDAVGTAGSGAGGGFSNGAGYGGGSSDVTSSPPCPLTAAVGMAVDSTSLVVETVIWVEGSRGVTLSMKPVNEAATQCSSMNRRIGQASAKAYMKSAWLRHSCVFPRSGMATMLEDAIFRGYGDAI